MDLKAQIPDTLAKTTKSDMIASIVKVVKAVLNAVEHNKKSHKELEALLADRTKAAKLQFRTALKLALQNALERVETRLRKRLARVPEKKKEQIATMMEEFGKTIRKLIAGEKKYSEVVKQITLQSKVVGQKIKAEISGAVEKVR